MVRVAYCCATKEYTLAFQFKQFMGECNKLDWAMRACTKKERLKAVEENRAEAKKRVENMQKKMGALKSDDWRENLKEKLEGQKS